MRLEWSIKQSPTSETEYFKIALDSIPAAFFLPNMITHVHGFKRINTMTKAGNESGL